MNRLLEWWYDTTDGSWLLFHLGFWLAFAVPVGAILALLFGSPAPLFTCAVSYWIGAGVSQALSR
jgi:hypothetical protein